MITFDDDWFIKSVYDQSSSPMASLCSPQSESSDHDYRVEIMFWWWLSDLFHILNKIIMTRYAPLGDLTSNITEAGLGEQHTKRVAKQVLVKMICCGGRDGDDGDDGDDDGDHDCVAW